MTWPGKFHELSMEFERVSYDHVFPAIPDGDVGVSPKRGVRYHHQRHRHSVRGHSQKFPLALFSPCHSPFPAIGLLPRETIQQSVSYTGTEDCYRCRPQVQSVTNETIYLIQALSKSHFSRINAQNLPKCP